MRICRRPNRHNDDRLCFCPSDPSAVRAALARPFINGWVNERWHNEAITLSRDPAATQEQLETLLFRIEDAANDAYGMWRDTR